MLMASNQKEEYRQVHNASGLKVGDKVTIIRVPTDWEGGWQKHCLDDERKNYVGMVGVINNDEGVSGFRVKVDGMKEYPWPCFVLRKDGAIPTSPMAPTSEILSLGKPVTLVQGEGKTIVIFNGKALLAGQYTKEDLQKVLASDGW